MELITKYIKELGFNKNSNIQKTDFGDLFLYETLYTNPITKNNTIIPFLFFESTNNLFAYHLIEWNKNELDYFIAVDNYKSYIIKAKEKPDSNFPLRKEGKYNKIWNTDNIPNGIYYCNIKNCSNTETKKIVINKQIEIL